MSGMQDILARRRPPIEAQAANNVVTQAPSQVTNEEVDNTAPTPSRRRPLAKSNDPEYLRVTAYIRRTTDAQLRRKLLEQDRREISDVIEALLDGWIAGRFQA